MIGRELTSVLLSLVALSGCASDATVRSAAPEKTYVSRKGIDPMVSCLIPSLSRHYTAAAISNFRFVGQVLQPNAEYDIVPTDGFVNGHYIYTVNVKKAPDGGSVVSLYKGQPMLPHLTAAMENGIAACL
ncbi:MAG: hypothetical protein V9G18_09810 [Albidovulum sp.]|jgi:hypothetical protein